MYRRLKALGLFCLCLATVTPLYAAVFTSEVDNPFAYPRQIEGRYLDIGKTPFADTAFKHEKIALRQWMVQGNHTHCIAPATGLWVSGTYYDTTFRWINNPFFQQSRYPEVQVMAGLFTGLAPRWQWRGALGVSVQTQHIALGRYGTVRGLFWGRYRVTPCFGAHLGALFCRGLRSTYVMPILGIDWQIKPTVRLDAVFPLDVALRWCPNKIVSAALAGRWMRARFRAGNENVLRQGLFEFRTWGVEGRLTCTPTQCMGIDLFAGSTIWGWTRIQSPCGRTLQFRNTKGAPYAGAEAYLRF
jgi:hypothetical protein